MNRYEAPGSPLFPQMARQSSVRSMMLDVIVALIPAFAMSVFLFGRWALVLGIISVTSCLLFETLYRRLTRQNNTIHDLSACVTGLLLAMSLPSDAAWWVPMLGAAFAIVVVKQFYGGLGRNFMNPALAGRMLLASFPALMTSWVDPLRRLSTQSVDSLSAATPMAYLHAGTLPPMEVEQLLLGQHGGSLGEGSVFLLLLGGAYLIARRVISARIPLAYLGTVALLTFLTPPAGCSPVEWMLAQLCSGGLILAAFFMATDPTTSPVTPVGQILFGAGCGLLTFILRYFSSYPEGVGWAILTMNCCVWLLDKAGMPRRFGAARFSVQREWLAAAKANLSQIHFVRPVPRHTREGQAPGEALLDLLRRHGPGALAMAGVLAGVCVMIHTVHYATELATVQAETARQRELLEQVMPKAAFSSEAPYRVNGALSLLAAYDEYNTHLGYCVEVQHQGFGGVITMVVGVDLDGKVTGVAVTDHNETASVAEEALYGDYLDRFVGRSGTIRTSGTNRVDVVTGATATSKAITAGVNRALAILADLGEDNQLGEEDYAIE